MKYFKTKLRYVEAYQFNMNDPYSIPDHSVVLHSERALVTYHQGQRLIMRDTDWIVFIAVLNQLKAFVISNEEFKDLFEEAIN
ncbi:hypothetical protein AAG747_15295 [Rapidithrix thailandica]|uniref:Uncharacterized protein n=1 Tax=Rapidithrix thailandica TaxID=413964 RepID=A0AAW9SD47_9BACT